LAVRNRQKLLEANVYRFKCRKYISSHREGRDAKTKNQGGGVRGGKFCQQLDDPSQKKENVTWDKWVPVGCKGLKGNVSEMCQLDNQYGGISTKEGSGWLSNGVLRKPLGQITLLGQKGAQYRTITFGRGTGTRKTAD